MNTEETKFYCIRGLIRAAQSSARDTESHEALIQELKKNHIPENTSLITEASFHSSLAERCAADCLPNVIDAIVSEYNQLGYSEQEVNPEACVSCGTCLLGWY